MIYGHNDLEKVSRSMFISLDGVAWTHSSPGLVPPSIDDSFINPVGVHLSVMANGQLSIISALGRCDLKSKKLKDASDVDVRCGLRLRAVKKAKPIQTDALFRIVFFGRGEAETNINKYSSVWGYSKGHFELSHVYRAVWPSKCLKVL